MDKYVIWLVLFFVGLMFFVFGTTDRILPYGYGILIGSVIIISSSLWVIRTRPPITITTKGERKDV